MGSESYSLRQMVDMTGITEFTLRGWELRYGAFAPDRTETGRRRYSARDLQKALLLRELVKREHRIGSIASKSVSELKKLMGAESGQVETTAKPYKAEIQEAMKYVALQDWVRLDSILSTTIKGLKPLSAIRDFILPIFDQMNLEVAFERVGIAQEHILSAMLKQNLNRLRTSEVLRPDVKMIFASPEGDLHELGILAASAMANQFGFRTLFIGPNTPKKELCETASHFGATHIVLGSTVTKKEGAADDFYTFVHFLDQNLSQNTALWFGGRASQPVHLKREAVRLGSLLELEGRFSELSGSRGEK